MGHENSKSGKQGKTVIAVIKSKLMRSRLRFRGEMQKKEGGKEMDCLFILPIFPGVVLERGRFSNVNHF